MAPLKHVQAVAKIPWRRSPKKPSLSLTSMGPGMTKPTRRSGVLGPRMIFLLLLVLALHVLFRQRRRGVHGLSRLVLSPPKLHLMWWSDRLLQRPDTVQSHSVHTQISSLTDDPSAENAVWATKADCIRTRGTKTRSQCRSWKGADRKSTISLPRR